MTAMKDDFYHGGLTDDEVRKSREKYGVNLLTPPKRPSLWKLYLEKFEDPVVRVLLVAALFSLIISIVENEYAETIGIIAAILLATGIGFFFEYDANKKFDLLNAVNEETLVKVIRNGRVQEIPRKDVVVGDIIVLETGEEIPADGELLEAISLQVNESNLTGEPVINKILMKKLRMLPIVCCVVLPLWTVMGQCECSVWAMIRKSEKWPDKVRNRVRNLLP